RDRRGRELPALEGAAGADHTYGVEALGSRQGAGSAVLDRPQEAHAPVDVLDDLAELIQHLEPPAGPDLRPAPERFHGELEPGAGGGQRVAELVGDDTRERGGVVERIEPAQSRP